jgi:excinuclease ABC subunit C
MVSAVSRALKKAPKSFGVYLFKDANKQVIYVGKAINLKIRLRFYVQNYSKIDKINALVNQTESVQFIKVGSEIEALLLEVNLIKNLRPKFNVIWRDDKRPIYVKITKEQLPRVNLSRKIEEKGINLYGPFPSVAKIKAILRFLRKIFPYSSLKNPKYEQLWVDLGLAPNIKQANKLSEVEKTKFIENYQQNIKYIKMFLAGQIKSLIKILTQKMNQESKRENFEQAARVRDKINLLKFLIDSRKSLDQYLNTPSLLATVGKAQTQALQELLDLSTLRRIEGYDVANISGQLATGSLVVFTNGYPDKDEYRRFKIRVLTTPNDPAMIAQVVRRRFNHPEWEFPDLLIIDGGKGQLSAVKKVLKDLSIKVPLIGLAKRLEQIIIPFKEEYLIRRLATDSPALQLIQKVRDEAHRFTTTYHKKLVWRHLTK